MIGYQIFTLINKMIKELTYSIDDKISEYDEWLGI